MKRTILLGGAALSLIALLGAGCVNNSTPKPSDKERAVENTAPNNDKSVKEKTDATSSDEKEDGEEGVEKRDVGVTQKNIDSLKADLQSLQADDVSGLTN
jgi:hypothetical protein